MKDFRDFINQCHRIAVEKDFYRETQVAELPNDTWQLDYLALQFILFARDLQLQRKQKLVHSMKTRELWSVLYPFREEKYSSIGMTSRKAHTLRQILHLGIEIGEFLEKWEESDYRTWDYEEFADIFIVYADLAGFMGTEQVVKAIEDKMAINRSREIHYGRKVDSVPVDLAAQPEIVEEITANAPTFAELQRALENLPMTEVTSEKIEEEIAEEKEEKEKSESYKKVEEPQEKVLQKVFHNEFPENSGSEPLLRGHDAGLKKLQK